MAPSTFKPTVHLVWSPAWMQWRSTSRSTSSHLILAFPRPYCLFPCLSLKPNPPQFIPSSVVNHSQAYSVPMSSSTPHSPRQSSYDQAIPNNTIDNTSSPSRRTLPCYQLPLRDSTLSENGSGTVTCREIVVYLATVMAENKRPLTTIEKPRINRKQMTSNNTSGGMDADRLSVLVDTTRMQLISPPPEEMLRPVNPPSPGTTTAIKRKRTRTATTFSSTPLQSRDVNDNDLGIQYSQQQPMEATPNPKPRKKRRLHSRQSLLESPTVTLFGHLRASPVSNDDTSMQHTPSRSKMKKVLVKYPHANNPHTDFIDVPALVFPTRRKMGARSSRRSATPIIPYEPSTDVFTPPREVFLSPVTNSMSKSSKRKTIASASAFKSAKGKKKSSTLTIVTAVKQELPDIDLTLPMPPPSPTDDPLLLLGPPELDFFSELMPPRRREMSVQVQAVEGDLPPPIAMGEAVMELNEEEDAEEQKVRRMSVGPEQLDEEAEEKEEVRWMPPEQLLELNEEEAVEEQEVRRLSVEPGQLDEEEAEEQKVRCMSVEPEQLLENEGHEEEHEVRQILVELDDEELASPFDNPDRLQDTENLACENQAASFIPCHLEQEEDDDQIRDDSDELGHGIVKITRADPLSAARAAAILKQHDYDCYTNIGIKRRHQEAFIPGSPMMTLPELLKEAELEVRDSQHLSQRSLVLPAREDPFHTSQEGSTLSPAQETFPQSEVEETSHSSDVPSTTIGKREKGLLFSYLPTLSKPSFSTVSKAPLSVQPSLPIPPIEILSKSRVPVITPARAPLLKPKHPKELVVLHPIPQQPTVSHIPRLKKPQRLVELHSPAPLPMIEPIPIVRPRRSSGSSVKDLVRGFEEIQAVSHDKVKYNVGWKIYRRE